MRIIAGIFALVLTFGQSAFPKQQPDPRGHENSGNQPPSPTTESPTPAHPCADPKQTSTNGEPNKTICQRLIEPLIANWPLVAIAIPAIFVGWLTLETMRKSSEQQLRAYVLPELGNIVNVATPLKTSGTYTPTEARITQPDWGPVSLMHIKNTGQTPAFKVVHWGNIVFREYPLKSELPSETEGLKSASTIGPGIINTKRRSITKPLTGEEIRQLRDGTGAIYVYGFILYEDAFGNKHVTHYRTFHNGNSGAVGISTDLTYTEEGNEAD